MADANPNTPNPSKASPSLAAVLSETHAEPHEIDAAIYELAGAASVAALMLRALHRDPAVAETKSHEHGLLWLGDKLAAAQENIMAIHEGRPATWDTMSEMESVQKALARAEQRGMARDRHIAQLHAKLAAE